MTPARTIPGRELEAQFPHRARVRYLTLPGPDEPAAEGVGTVVGVVETIEDTGNGETGPCVTIDLALLVLPDDEPTALYVCRRGPSGRPVVALNVHAPDGHRARSTSPDSSRSSTVSLVQAGGE